MSSVFFFPVKSIITEPGKDIIINRNWIAKDKGYGYYLYHKKCPPVKEEIIKISPKVYTSTVTFSNLSSLLKNTYGPFNDRRDFCYKCEKKAPKKVVTKFKLMGL